MTPATSLTPIGDSFDFTSTNFCRDPWAVYGVLRERGPVHYSRPTGCYVVVGHAAVCEGLTHDNVVADYPFRTSRRVFGRNVLDLDGAAHKLFRRFIAPLLGPHAVRQYAKDVVKPVVDEIVGALPRGEPLDVVPAIASEVPYRVICRLMGFPADDCRWLYDRMRPIAHTLDYPPDTSEAVVRAKHTVEEYFSELLRHDRIPADSMSGRILHAMERSEMSFDRTEILATLLLVLLAGTETSVAAIANVLSASSSHPEMFDRCDSAEYAASFAHEVLRLKPSVHSVLRFAQDDTELGGTPIRRRSPILFCLASANRDETVFAEPDALSPGRGTPNPVTFATGPHACPGMNLAIAEFSYLTVAARGRFDTVRAEPDSTGEHGFSFRHPRDLKVTFA